MAEDIRKMESTIGKKSFEVEYKTPDCFVLDSAYCSMGRMIGYKACEKAGYAYYDAATLIDLLPNCSYTKEDVDRIEAKYRTRLYTKEEMENDTELVDMMKMFEEAVKLALKNGPCLIHDRTTREMVQALGYSCVSLFTTSENKAYKIERAQTSPLYKHITDHDEVLNKIEEENNIRRNIHHFMSDTPWGETETYDVILNADQLGREYCASIVAHIMQGN